MAELSQHNNPEQPAADGSRRRKKRRPRQPDTRWSYIIAIAVVAGAAGAFSTAEPTGTAVFDVLERAAFAVIITLFAACSRRWTWLILAGVATVFAATVWGHLLGAVALGFAVHAAWRSDNRDRLTGALIGALSVQALLRTADIGFFGLTAIITAITATIVIVSGYRTVRRRNRSRILIGVGVIAVFTVIATAAFVYSAIRASDPLEYGIKSARRGLDVANKADQVGAAGYWTSAHTAFAKADGFLSSPLAKLSYPIPVLSQHARLAAVASDSGSSITETAARAATVAPYHRIRAADGSFDLDRIASMEKPVRQTARAMTNARHDVDTTATPWLVEPFRDRVDDYRHELSRAIPQAEDALTAIHIAPEVLGGHGERRYLLLFANPAETRGLGGFIGAWGQLDAKDGHLELVRHGKMADLNDATDPATRTIKGEAEYMRRYGHLQPARFIQNISASPDFPTVARVAEQLYPQAGGTKVDGVMYIDPIALGALLKLTGPVMAEGIPVPLTSENAADFLMHDQYVDVPDVDERSDLLSNAAEATFDALTDRELPSISEITDTLSPMMHQERIMATVNDSEANHYFSSIGLTGAFPKPDDRDLISVRVSNGSENKADYYLRKKVGYTARHDEATGKTTGEVGIVFSNKAPGSGEPAYVLGNQDTRAGRTDGRPFGSTTLQVSVYSVLRPTKMTIGTVASGEKVSEEEVGMQIQHELGYWVATQTVTIPPQSLLSVGVTVEGRISPDETYALTTAQQPLAKNTRFALVFQPVDSKGKRLAMPEQRFSHDKSGVHSFTTRQITRPID